MATEKPNKSSAAVYGVVFTVIALVALIAIVLVRSKAQTNSALLNQMTASTPVAMTLNSQTLTQDQGGSSSADVGYVGSAAPDSSKPAVLMVAGSYSKLVHLHVDFTAPNGVANTVLQPGALIQVIARSGNNVLGDAISWDCPSGPSGTDGRNCWSGGWSGSMEPFITNPAKAYSGGIPSDVVTVASGDVTHGYLDVNMPYPFYAVPGTWTYSWRIVPVDATGAADSAHTLSNIASSSDYLKASHADLVAVDVATDRNSGGGLSATYGVAAWDGVHGVYCDSSNPGCSFLAPGDVSGKVLVTVNQRGNVNNNVKVYGQDWTCSSGQSMDVSTTRVIGRRSNVTLGALSTNNMKTVCTDVASCSLLATNDVYEGAASFDYSAAGTMALSVSQQYVTAPDVTTGDPIRFVVPTADGSQFGDIGVEGYDYYETGIKIPSGISGNCQSTLTNIAVKAS